MADFLSNINEINVCIEPYVFTEDITGGTKYIGTSASFPIITAEVWKIKKQWLSGGTCYMGFPNGCQDFKFIWDCRGTYTYK